MPACAITPADKRRQAKLVGEDLVKNYGKKRYYTPLEIRNANRHGGIPIDVVCWSYAIYASMVDFDAHHQKLGETCDYAAMKTEMLSSIGGNVDVASVTDTDLSWLEVPSVDWSLFDFLDFS